MRTNDLTRVSVTELVQRPGELVDRVLQGERVLICRHRRPVATLQPLTGVVVQPFVPADFDVTGSPLGDAGAEVDKLTPAQQALLLDGVRLGRFVVSRVEQDHDLGEINVALRELVVRGLARKSDRGVLITGRGMVLREELYVRNGRSDCDWVR